MSKKAMYDLRNMLCDELDELARKGELGAGDLEIAHKLTDTIKNIDKIEMMESEGYSGTGDWEAIFEAPTATAIPGGAAIGIPAVGIAALAGQSICGSSSMICCGKPTTSG